MPNRPGSHRANIIIEVGHADFQATINAALDRQVDAVAMDLELAYRSPGPHVASVEVSIQIDYNIRAVTLRPSSSSSSSSAVPDDADEHRNNDNDVEPNPTLPTAPTIFSAAAGLLGFLPRVNIDDMPDGDKSCIMCLQRFPDEGVLEAYDADTPLLLRCKHVVGRACIERWILGGHNSCPLCRAEIFEPARE